MRIKPLPLRAELQDELNALKSAMASLRLAVGARDGVRRSDGNPTGDLKNLLALADLFCAHSHLSEATISNKITAHARLFSRIRENKGCTVKTFHAATTWFSENWPADLAWPKQITRPIAPANSARQRLLCLANTLAAHQGVTHWAISMRLAGKGDFFRRLENGTNPRTDTFEKMLQRFSDNWPADLEWPSEVSRPALRVEGGDA